LNFKLINIKEEILRIQEGRDMEKYRKLKVIGKGSFGYAVLVQSVVDRQTYVMKVGPKLKALTFVSIDH